MNRKSLPIGTDLFRKLRENNSYYVDKTPIIKEKTLFEKINDIYHMEVEHTDRPTFLLSSILTKHYDDNSLIESTQFWGAYSANLGMNLAEDESFNANYSFDYINVGLDGKFKDNNADG